MKNIAYARAVHDALHEEMERDEKVILIGEDIGVYGGAFKTCLGLYGKFPGRVFDTPLAESSIVSAALGMAMMGLKPVAEIMFADFLGVCFDTMVNQIPKMNYCLGGKTPLNLVVRMPYGTGSYSGFQHSQAVEPWLMNTPGINIVIPSTAYDLKGLLKASIRYDGPVLFLESKYLYKKNKSGIPDEEYLLPIDKADIKREGSDVSIISYGASLHTSLQAAEELEKEGISAEVLDLISVKPLDEEAILKTASKTGRVIVVHEAPKTGGVGGEVCGVIAENVFDSLKKPVIRLGGYDAPVPFSPVLEDAYIPQTSQVVDAAKRLM